MIVNFWRPYPLLKPKKAGWYQCKTKYNEYDTYVIFLYFDPIEGGKWIDRIRQSVFGGYKCYKPGRESLEYNRVHEDRICERIDVIAWRKIPTVYGWRKKKLQNTEQED